MYQKNQNQTQVPNLNNASVQHPSTSQPGGMVPEARQAGSIGGYMVKRLMEQAERQMANK